eukprot:jgi/Tetstr1/464160/TSEL_008965.t1
MGKIRKFTVAGSGIGWSGGQYTIKKDKATPVGAAHKAARRVWREALKKNVVKPFYNFIIREIGTKDTYSYRAYRVKLEKPKTFTRQGKSITSKFDYVAKLCRKDEFKP